MRWVLNVFATHNTDRELFRLKRFKKRSKTKTLLTFKVNFGTNSNSLDTRLRNYFQESFGQRSSTGSLAIAALVQVRISIQAKVRWPDELTCCRLQNILFLGYFSVQLTLYSAFRPLEASKSWTNLPGPCSCIKFARRYSLARARGVLAGPRPGRPFRSIT